MSEPPPPLPDRFTWEEYSRLRELPGPVYEIADGLYVYEATVFVSENNNDDALEETMEIRFFSESPLSEGVVYLSLCGYKLVFEHFHNRGVEVYEKLRAKLFVPVAGSNRRRRVFFAKPRVYDSPATAPRVYHEDCVNTDYLQFIFE